MIRFLSQLFGENVLRTHSKAATARREARPTMEMLEDRLVPTVVTSFHPPRVTLSLGNLHIECRDRLKGGPFNQQVVVETHDTYYGLEFHVRWSTKTTHLDWYFNPGQLYGGTIFFTGAKGDDTFQNNTDLRSYAWGGLGNDTLIGGTNQDVLMGEQGNDKIYGGGGKDYLSGGDDNDYIDGGGAFAANGQYSDNYDGVADYIHGNAGADKFKAEWVSNGITVFNRTNLDAPQDFNTAEGDTIVNPLLPIVAANFTNVPVATVHFGS